MIIPAPQSYLLSLSPTSGKPHTHSLSNLKLGDLLTSFANTLGTSPTGFLAPLILDDYCGRKQVPVCSKRSRQASMTLTDCHNDHPLADLEEPLTEITLVNSGVPSNVNDDGFICESLPDLVYGEESDSETYEHIQIVEPEITIPLTVYRLEKRPLISESPPRFGRDNAAFLRKFVAEKLLLEHGKITGITCRPRERPARSPHVLKRMGIVIAWPKVRKGRTWTVTTYLNI